jgi:hypothetical protein
MTEVSVAGHSGTDAALPAYYSPDSSGSRRVLKPNRTSQAELIEEGQASSPRQSGSTTYPSGACAVLLRTFVAVGRWGELRLAMSHDVRRATIQEDALALPSPCVSGRTGLVGLRTAYRRCV